MRISAVHLPTLMNNVFKFASTAYIKDFKLLDGAAPSANGTIHEITYERDSMHANTILKTGQEYSDSILYEYYVGLYLNKCAQCTPCFLHTYGLMRHTQNFKNVYNLTIGHFKNIETICF